MLGLLSSLINWSRSLC